MSSNDGELKGYGINVLSLDFTLGNSSAGFGREIDGADMFARKEHGA